MTCSPGVSDHMLGPGVAGHRGVKLEAGLGEGLQLRHGVSVGGVVEVVVGAVTHYLSWMGNIDC